MSSIFLFKYRLGNFLLIERFAPLPAVLYFCVLSLFEHKTYLNCGLPY